MPGTPEFPREVGDHAHLTDSDMEGSFSWRWRERRKLVRSRTVPHPPVCFVIRKHTHITAARRLVFVDFECNCAHTEPLRITNAAPVDIL